ncbi:T9SS type A sorting domain-containing protein [Fulvivirga maritima]|uniref:T9SS type A sorting domain-containing protein n=1 Tax=Fulvivirga maritima TaxID=2904247 RepID=UPI001F48E23B|nr:T9SS type A sorting domain-containing protein [Fulvivirga maritima]UII28769.1 T9SS type A sorting domain-containing protein [Fulvivirga maritima]
MPLRVSSIGVILLLIILLPQWTAAQNSRVGEWISCSKVQTVNRKPSTAVSEEITVGNFRAVTLYSPAEALPAIKSVLSKWNAQVTTNTPIKISLEWAETGNFMALTRPSSFIRNFSTNTPNNIWYPIALAEKLAGKELNNPDDFEIEIKLNAGINWYFGIDGKCDSNQIDLYTILLHEITHGMGFISSAEQTPEGVIFSTDESFSVFDRLLMTGDHTRLINYESPQLLEDLLSEGDIFISNTSDNDSYWKCYSPITFSSGVSLSHWDHDENTSNTLMRPFFDPGTYFHEIDERTNHVLKSIGWDQTESSLITAFPNPANDVINLKWPPYLDKIDLKIYNSQGLLILSQKLNNTPHEKATVQVSLLDQGMYFMHVQSADFRVNKIIKIIITD